jgi:division/cell wall cluster transcriptional repressor MraZ
MEPSTQTSSAPKFTGKFCHKVEGKNRIFIPAGWRFDHDVTLYMIVKELKPCVSVLTQSEYERLEESAEKMDDAERSHFLDALGSHTVQASMDKGGRISIPEELFEILGLPKARSVWLTGSVKSFNIWSVANYEAHEAGEAERAKELKRKRGI